MSATRTTPARAAGPTARVLRWVAPVLAACALLWCSATPATAHAVLVSAAPADGQQLDAPPDEVRLEFNEPVAVSGGGVRLHDATGTVLPLGTVASAGEVVSAPLTDLLPEGSYILTWRVTSADGHPVAGALIFSVGDPEALDGSLLRQIVGTGSDRPAAALGAVVRAAGYLAVLVAAGGVAFLLWAADARDRPGLVPLVRRTALTGIAAVLLALPAQAAQLGGQGLRGALRPDLLGEALRGGVGLQSVVQAAALAVLVMALRRGDRLLRPLALPAAMLAVLALVLAGHTRTTAPAWLVVPADAVHALAAAAWLGGLVLLWRSLRRRRRDDDPVGAAGTVARFSRNATVAVAAVTLAGLTLSWLLVRTGDALLSTAYGRILLLKVGLAVAVLGVGAYNQRRLVPAITAARGDGRDGARAAWRRLRTTVRWEVAGLTLVVAVTAVLVNVQPAAEAAGVTGALSTSVAVGDDARLSITIDPNRAGYNELHLYLLDATGRPADTTDLQLRMSLPEAGIGPIVREPAAVSAGHWLHTGRELAVAGRWEIEAVVGVSRFAQERATITVDVRP